MHDLTEEDLRQIWRDLYLHAVKSSNCVTPAIVHGHARETADAYVNSLRAEKKAADDAFTATLAAAEPTLEWVRTAEDERRDMLVFLSAEIDKHEAAMETLMSAAARERCSARAEILRTMSAYIERGDHVGAADRKAVKP